MRAKTVTLMVLGLTTVQFGGCVPFFVQPKTYQCAGIDDWDLVREGGRQVAYCQGMSRAELEREYVRAKAVGSFLANTTLKHGSRTDSYLVYKGCRVWRYRFENDRLVEVGTAIMEMGIWSYWSQGLSPCSHSKR